MQLNSLQNGPTFVAFFRVRWCVDIDLEAVFAACAARISVSISCAAPRQMHQEPAGASDAPAAAAVPARSGSVPPSTVAVAVVLRRGPGRRRVSGLYGLEHDGGFDVAGVPEILSRQPARCENGAAGEAWEEGGGRTYVVPVPEDLGDGVDALRLVPAAAREGLEERANF